MTLKAIRADFLHCLADPGAGAGATACEDLADGLLVIRDGLIDGLQPAATLLPLLGGDIEIEDWRGHLVVPGFVDTHAHYPQVDVIASHATQLLDWLERYTYPEERKFAERSHAEAVATFFLDRLIENGTTTAAVFCTVHPQSAEAFFAAAEQRNLRMIAGKCLMDRHCPEYLRDTAESAYRESKALIERWHGKGRLGYAITPRFAPTSTPAQLAACGRLAREHPDTWIQSHVAESKSEVTWARELFPGSRSYLDVYDRAGLLRERAVYGHCIWLDDADRARMAASGTAAAFCPTSNLFLGSGLYDYRQASAAGVTTGLATDVGGGTSYSMLTTMAEGYKVQQLLGTNLHPAELLYLATLAGAQALGLAHRIGNFAPGKEADFAVLAPAATPQLARRTGLRENALDRFFALMMLGDKRAVAATYVMGNRF
ncbi:MAG: guanine deaminase [Betaproteobacteria bacterium]|nr:guanine deaminase [Betaproteobacteria bacterium]